MTDSFASITIGTHEVAPSVFEDYFTGSIDEVRIYDRVLTTNEIATLYLTY